MNWRTKQNNGSLPMGWLSLYHISLSLLGISLILSLLDFSGSAVILLALGCWVGYWWLLEDCP
jgi:hypothetical protein